MAAQRVEVWREVARRIAHEIKNPLTPIQLSAQRLQRKLSARVGGEDPWSAAVGDDRDARSFRQRLVDEQVRGLEQLLERVDPDHAGLTEQGVDDAVG